MDWYRLNFLNKIVSNEADLSCYLLSGQASATDPDLCLSRYSPIEHPNAALYNAQQIN